MLRAFDHICMEKARYKLLIIILLLLFLSSLLLYRFLKLSTCHVDSFLDPTYVSVRISINKLDLVPNRIAAGLVGVFRNGGGLVYGRVIIPVVFFNPSMHRSPCFLDVDFAALAGNPVDYTILFSWVDGVLWSHYV